MAMLKVHQVLVVVINYQLIKLIIDPTFSIKLLINYYNKFYPLQ